MGWSCVSVSVHPSVHPSSQLNSRSAGRIWMTRHRNRTFECNTNGDNKMTDEETREVDIELQ